ncbi:MAG TPA: NUDIX hydrolase [Candidatus Kapabacteria bacterium]|nr:NUDIX hydrolase [Candidatus Kapabacteria bacterium]
MTTSEQNRQIVLDAVSVIEPLDELEAAHKAEVLAWIPSGALLYRIAKPADPPKHLVSYFVLVDSDNNSVLLVDHINAQKWLPTGGHVELNEDPKTTVEREVQEELGIAARFTPQIKDKPLFITSTQTVGLTAGHIDISLWYVLEGSKGETFNYDKNEFADVKWFTFKEILETEPSRMDPHMHRFVNKLMNHLP